MKNKKGLQNRDVFERMNFLLQAATLMAGKNNVLSAYYGSLLKNVGKKSVLRISPEIKRVICKRCGLYLKSGVTCDLSMDEQNRNLFIVECKVCKLQKKFQVNSKYKLWIENPESIAETYRNDDAEQHTITIPNQE